MTFREKFDDIINCIEYFVGTGEEDIPQALVRETGFNLRLLGDAFQFITDITLVKYIRQRRLIHALTHKLQDNLSVEDIIAGTLFCDAAAFTKACKNEFGLTPGQITEDVLAKYPPLYFSIVTTGNSTDQLENNTSTTPKNDTVQGVSSEQFAQIRRALEVSAIYGFDNEESEFVYRFATECHISVEEAAEFCEEAKMQEKYDLTSHEAQQLLYEIRGNGYDHLYDLPEGFFDIYFSEANNKCGWFVPHICEIIDSLNNNGMSIADFKEIVFHAEMFGIDIIEAIEYFDQYKKAWDDIVSGGMWLDIPEDDTDVFGYRSIWEFDEE